jgi:aminopeptidase-like protein
MDDNKKKYKIITGDQMIHWMKEMWDFPRSITGNGTKKTLEYLKQINPKLSFHQFKTGTKVFDWNIPQEWNIFDSYIEHESGKRFAEFSKNNLHVLGYSIPCNMELTLSELLPNVYTQKDQPDVIPYVTSYYEDRWGFCMSENEKNSLPEGKYRVVIDSIKDSGNLELADIVIKGKSKQEVFFSTYICHPSMANNELSGPVLSSALIKYITSNYKNSEYTYRFVFAPETIGSIAYLSKNINLLKENVICGFNLSCVGDNRSYSHIESKRTNTLADSALISALIDLDNVKSYSFLDRGSDERQYCAPDVNLPFCGFCRSKYEKFPEYHTSADNFDVVTKEGLEGSFAVMKSIIDAFEMNLYPKTVVTCEPQLGRRGLRSTISQKGEKNNIRSDLIAYSDGENNLFDISIKIKRNLSEVISEAIILKQNNLITFQNKKL